MASGPLGRLAAEHPIIVCCGSGGVGKTTTAAVLALAGARAGRNAVVVTIDPAKRLANALGLDALSDTAHEIDRAIWDPGGAAPPEGRLSALMLDTKSTFDHLVLKYSADPTQGRGSSRTASTGTSPVPWRARRSTWPWRSSTSCTRRAGTS